MESEQQIIRPTTGPSAIGDIGGKYACEYLKEEGVIVAALGSLIDDAHAGHVEENTWVGAPENSGSKNAMQAQNYSQANTLPARMENIATLDRLEIKLMKVCKIY